MDFFVFDSEMKEAPRVVTQAELIEATEVKEINKAGQLTFSLPLIADRANKVQPTDLVLIHIEEDKYRPYKVVAKNIQGNKVSYSAVEYAYYIQEYDGIVHDYRPDNKPLDFVLNHNVFNGTQWRVRYVDKDLPHFTGRFYWETRTSALKKIVEQTGAEFNFYMVMSRNKITDRVVEAYRKAGTDTHKRFEYGSNLLEVVQEQQTQNVYTKIYPRGKGIKYENGEGEDPTYGRRLQINEVEWKRENGDPVDKPLGQDFVTDGTGHYRFENGNDPSIHMIFEDIENDAMKLLQTGYDWLLENNRPKVQFKAQLSDVGDLKLGDRIIIVRPDLDIRYTTRVFKVTTNLLQPKLSTVELGDNLVTTFGDAIGNINQTIKDYNNKFEEINTNISFIENTTGNQINYGYDTPANNRVGDIWFKYEDVDGKKVVTIMQWDGEKWVEQLSNKMFDELNEKIKESEELLKNAIDNSNQAQIKADELEKEFEEELKNTDKKIESVIKDTENNSEKISNIYQSVNGVQIKVDNLASETEGKITVLDDLIKSTVAQLGATYPNGNFSDTDVHKYYETFNDKTTIEDYQRGEGLIFHGEAGDNPLYLQTSYTDYEHIPNYDNLMWFDFEHELSFEGEGNVYVQIYKYNESGDEINHEYFNLNANKGRINQTHNFWYEGGSVHHIRWCIGANLSPHSKFELKLYKMRFGANGDESVWNMYLKDPHYDRYFDRNGYMSPITTNTKNKVLKLEGNPSDPQSFANAKLKDFIKVNPKEKLTVTFDSMVEYSYKSKRECYILLHQFTSGKEKIKEDKQWIKYDKSSEWYKNTQDFNLDPNTEYIKIEFIYWYMGTPETATMYIDNVYIQNGKDTVSSSISQLAGDINIKVDKNDVINQINISDEEILIAGNRIHLTGETIIDDAIITSAMIKDLTADKITAGTINAENVNIVNLRVESLVGDTTKFVQSQWNSINRSIRIDGDGITFYNDNNENLIINNNMLCWTASNGSHMLKYERVYDGAGGHGAVALNIAAGQHFHLGMSKTGYWDPIISFDGQDGHMRVPNGRKLYMGSTGNNIMFTEHGLQGIGNIAMIMNEEQAAGIGFAGTGIVIVKDNHYEWL